VIEAIFNPYPSDHQGPFTRPRTPAEELRRKSPTDDETQFETQDSGTATPNGGGHHHGRRLGHFGGRRLKTAFGAIKCDSRNSSNRDLKGLSLESSMTTGHGKAPRGDVWAADTGKKGWGKKRSPNHEKGKSLGPMEPPTPSLDPETGMPT
jgi:hypothetical protein